MNTLKQIMNHSTQHLPRGVAIALALAAASGCALPDPESEDGAEAAEAAEESEATSDLSSGGCTGAFPISSCISRSGNSVISDFYMNAVPDTSRYTYRMEVTRSRLGSSWGSSKRIDHGGHYPAVNTNIAAQPWKSGCSRTIVHVYTLSGGPHGDYASPEVCY